MGAAGAAPGAAGRQWVPIATISGSQPTTSAVNVPHDALQWRTRWQCSSGELSLIVTPDPRAGGSRVDSACPSVGKALWAGTGQHQVHVLASGAFRITVEEFPLPRSTTAP